MVVAEQAGIFEYVVLDRPNPINGIQEPPFASFIGRLPIPLRFSYAESTDLFLTLKVE
jgi:uncharacterized protein YbbC (DUF1343 family)